MKRKLSRRTKTNSRKKTKVNPLKWSLFLIYSTIFGLIVWGGYKIVFNSPYFRIKTISCNLKIDDSFYSLAKERLHSKVITVPEGWTKNGYIRLMQSLYFIGAGISLLILLIPTLYREGLSFFKPYTKNQLISFSKNDE